MYVPDINYIISTTSPIATAFLGSIMPLGMWFVGISVAGIFLSVLIGLPQWIMEKFPGSRIRQAMAGDEMAAMRRAGYQRYYDPSSRETYWKKGSSRAFVGEYDYD